ncbi:saccharopine dehydrogenase NADP-binding domain-containing protein (plasmid) [Aminobacter sp. BA135]|uniref:saccharopine dehydrogenase family protein n=1 Tax=Aminobacter sp. BA135 TaxID=537596 RepID=UPI003D79E287
MEKFKLTIFGAGNVGTALAVTLTKNSDFAIQLVDHNEDALHRARALNIDAGFRALRGGEELDPILSDQDMAVSAVPNIAVPRIAAAAARAGVHYLDFSAAKDQTRSILEPLSQRRAVMTGCGASPGIVENIAFGLLREFSPVSDLIIRLGAIPRYPNNRLGYGQIWNVDGLIDEYTLPSMAIRNGQLVALSPLEDYERFCAEGVNYEAFATSGGVDCLKLLSDSTLRNATFKTIRYPNHLDYMRFLLDDLDLRNRRDMLKSLLYNGLPVIEDDVVLVVVTARGYRGRQPTERTVCHRFASVRSLGPFNALTQLAAGYAGSLISALQEGSIPLQGTVVQHGGEMAELLSSPYLSPLLVD